MLEVGKKAFFSKTITETDVYLFAGISGDFNSVHINEEIASKTIFKKRIVHGCLVSGLISAVIGNKLPGEGTIYLEQDSCYKLPVFINDTITAEVEIAEIINEIKGIYKLTTKAINQKDEIVVDRYAIVKYKEILL